MMTRTFRPGSPASCGAVAGRGARTRQRVQCGLPRMGPMCANGLRAASSVQAAPKARAGAHLEQRLVALGRRGRAQRAVEAVSRVEAAPRTACAALLRLLRPRSRRRQRRCMCTAHGCVQRRRRAARCAKASSPRGRLRAQRSPEAVRRRRARASQHRVQHLVEARVVVKPQLSWRRGRSHGQAAWWRGTAAMRVMRR